MITKDGPIEFTPILFKPEDLICLKDERYDVGVICGGLGIPKALLDIAYERERHIKYAEAIMSRVEPSPFGDAINGNKPSVE